MDQIIIIEDNQGLHSVLSNALKKITDIEPFPRDNAEDAINLLKILPSIQLVITKNKIGSEETAKNISEYIAKNGLSTKLVVNGPAEIPSQYVVNKVGDYEQILYYCFKSLNIPLDKVRQKNIREYLPVKIELFKFLEFIPSDTFLKLKKPDGSDFYLRCYHQGDSGKASSIAGHISEGVSNFYILVDDEIPFHNVLSDRFTQILEVPNISLKERLDAMSLAFEVFSSLVGKWGFISCLAQIYYDLIASAKTVLEMHHFIPMVYEQLNRGKYNYKFKNFMNLSGVFFLLGRAQFMDLTKEVDKLMGVALFHDVRLNDQQSLIFSMPELKSAKLSDIQEETVIDHARDAAEIIKGEKDFPMDMANIIREHHGDISGLGFPSPPKGAVGHLSKVFLACERFLKELNESDGTPNMEKLHKILSEDTHKKILDRLYFIFSGGK